MCVCRKDMNRQLAEVEIWQQLLRSIKWCTNISICSISTLLKIVQLLEVNSSDS